MISMIKGFHDLKKEKNDHKYTQAKFHQKKYKTLLNQKIKQSRKSL